MDIKLALDKLELRPLDPYLEPKLNLFILGSKLSMDGQVRLRDNQGRTAGGHFPGQRAVG